MFGLDFRLALAPAALLTISACGGGGGGAAGASNFMLDYAGVTGNGTHGDPYILPSENQDGVTQGIEDYLDNSGYTVWMVDIDGLVQTTLLGTAEISGALLYDANSATWGININGEYREYRRSGRFYYYQGNCVYPDQLNECGSFSPWSLQEADFFGEDGLTTKYGALARLNYEDLENFVVAYTHFGLKTPDGNIPTTGTGSYDGLFVADVLLSGESGNHVVSGNATIDVNFETGDVSFSSAGLDTSPTAGYEYSATGDATITGNTYEGTMSASYDGVDGSSLTITADSGAMSGAFYGPAAEETAGVVYGSSVDGELAGGFWGIK